MLLVIKQQIVCDLLFSAIKELTSFSKGEKRNNMLEMPDPDLIKFKNLIKQFKTSKFHNYLNYKKMDKHTLYYCFILTINNFSCRNVDLI